MANELDSVAAHHVPGAGKLHIHPLRTGLVNETYRVQRDSGVYALRMAAENPYDLGLDHVWEARVLAAAVRADIAPALEYCDPQRGILITRWVDGRSWNPPEVRQPVNIARMAELMRRIHALPLPMPARVMSPLKWIDYYSGAARRSAARNSSKGVVLSGIVVPGTAAALRTAATDRLTALAALPSVDPVVCHSDLHTLNLIDRGRSLVLLDWEYAHAADPLWDLAGWSSNNDFEDELRQELLRSYMGRKPTHNDYVRLQLLGWLYDYVCLLWSELYLNLRQGARPDAALHGAAPDRAAEGDVSARAEVLAARLKFRHTTRP